MSGKRTNWANKAVRKVMIDYEMDLNDLAKVMGISRTQITMAMKFELSGEEQGRIIALIKEAYK